MEKYRKKRRKKCSNKKKSQFFIQTYKPTRASSVEMIGHGEPKKSKKQYDGKEK